MYSAVRRNEGNDADGRFSATCKSIDFSPRGQGRLSTQFRCGKGAGCTCKSKGCVNGHVFGKPADKSPHEGISCRG